MRYPHVRGAIMQVAFGVFANAKIQCEESISSRTPQNCATTSQFFVNDRRLFGNGISSAKVKALENLLLEILVIF